MPAATGDAWAEAEHRDQKRRRLLGVPVPMAAAAAAVEGSRRQNHVDWSTLIDEINQAAGGDEDPDKRVIRMRMSDHEYREDAREIQEIVYTDGLGKWKSEFPSGEPVDALFANEDIQSLQTVRELICKWAKKLLGREVVIDWYVPGP